MIGMIENCVVVVNEQIPRWAGAIVAVYGPSICRQGFIYDKATHDAFKQALGEIKERG